MENYIIEGKFWEDLFYWINVFFIEMLSFCEWIEDILLFLNELVVCIENEKWGFIWFNLVVIMGLCWYEWLGNVWELVNLVECLVIIYFYGVVGVVDLFKWFCYVDDIDED